MTMSNVVPMRAELPPPQFPMLTRVISNPLFNDEKKEITWTVGQTHPLVPNMKVIRMFVDRGGVEIYSVDTDGKNGMRNLIPMHWIRFIEEAMPPDVFVEELDASEAGPEDDDDDPEDEPEPDETPELVPATTP